MLGAQDVLGVHEEFSGVGGGVQARQGERRPSGRPLSELGHQVREAPLAAQRGHALGQVTGEGTTDDAQRGQLVLAQPEVDGKVMGIPALAQGRRVGACQPQRFGEGGPLGSSNAHWRSVATCQNDRVTGSLDPTISARLKRNPDGLVPAVVQEATSGAVLMLAWMDDEALRRTLETRRGTYWSRSRQCYWVKGETSGHTQTVREVRLDCDGDTVLLRVDQVGPACHTGAMTCFDDDPLLELQS